MLLYIKIMFLTFYVCQSITIHNIIDITSYHQYVGTGYGTNGLDHRSVVKFYFLLLFRSMSVRVRVIDLFLFSLVLSPPTPTYSLLPPPYISAATTSL